MMTTNRFFITAINLLIAVTCFGQEGYKRLTSAADLADGVTCAIVYHDSLYRNLRIEEFSSKTPIDSIKAFRNDKSYKTSADAIANSEEFTIKLHDGKYYLYNDRLGKYINAITSAVTKQINLQPLFYLTEKPQSLGVLTIETDDGTVDMKIGSKFLRHHKTVSEYRLVTNKNDDFVVVEIYVTTSKQEEAPTLTLSTTTDLGVTNFTGNVRLERTFEDNYLNTVVLPFEVSNPQEVFGAQAKVYEPKGDAENAVVFTLLAASAPMKAHTPYIITGTFASPPYLFKNVTIAYDPATTAPTTTVGSLSLHGVYQRKQMGGTQYFVLYRQKFYCCKSIGSLGIEPYKWYLESVGKADAKKVKFLLIK